MSNHTKVYRKPKQHFKNEDLNKKSTKILSKYYENTIDDELELLNNNTSETHQISLVNQFLQDLWKE